MTEIALDPELLADFIVESGELLTDFSAKVIDLESRAEDPDVIGAIFRAAHTLKGSSAFFNLSHIKNFAHKLENLLDELRNKTRRVSPEVIDLLLTGGNHLQDMFHRLGIGDYTVDLTTEQDGFLGRLLEFMETKEKPPLTPEEALRAIRALSSAVGQSGATAEALLKKIDDLLASLGVSAQAASPATPQAVAAPGERQTYVLSGVDLTEPLENALGIIARAESSGAFDEEGYGRAFDQLTNLIESHDLEAIRGPAAAALEDFEAVRSSSIDFDPIIVSLMKNKLEPIVGLVSVEIRPAEAAKTEPAAPPAEAAADKALKKAKEEKQERKTMRIDEEKVDGFMNYVGELIVTAETFNYLQKTIAGESVNPSVVRAFKNANQAFRELSDELQESLMEIRRVPIKGLLQKVNMMARELSHQMGKKVRVALEGHEVQLDKSIAESLEGPLVHVVRNSLDHGLETPDERQAAGKPPEGLLEVSAQADKEFFYLQVKDDGHGIDPEKMRRNAAAKGLMSESTARSLSDKEAVNLIFKAGFSTAKEITDVSGRGVGMDVVKTNIGQMNGTIQIDSKVGLGTTITLKIPLSVTLQVVKALLVRVGKDNFIISLDDIVESLRPALEDLTTIEGRGEVITRRGQIFPMVRLYQVFDIEPDITEPDKGILVVVDTNLGRHGFLVDEVLGQQQVVVKELSAQFKKLSFIAGSATLGDGRLGLVLDAEGVVRLARERS